MTASPNTAAASIEPVAGARPQQVPQVQPAPGPGPGPRVVETAAPGSAQPKRKGRRRVLMLVLPLAVALGGGWFWLTGGRYVATDNAYVQQPMLQISAEVPGRVAEVAVAEDQRVAEGDLLFRIDAEPFRIALAQAEAGLAAARLSVVQLHAAYDTAEARLRAAEDILDTRSSELERQKALQTKGLLTSSSLDSSIIAEKAAVNDVDLARQGVASAAAALGGDPKLEADKHPAVMAALAAVDLARRNLRKTTVRAPAGGIVAQVANLVPGVFVAAGAPVASLVENDRSWVEANFKETQLEGLSVGQKVEVTLDAYPGQTQQGEILSIGSATGAEFALIPAQNATGNWVKVVQRLPVRVSVVDSAGAPLRAGMSAGVSVDTGATRAQRIGLDLPFLQ
jgi:membrane fusion protein (multidrug efflux system)